MAALAEMVQSGEQAVTAARAHLEKDLKAAGFYDGVLNDKMGNDGTAALEKAKTQLGLGGPKNVVGPETLKACRRWNPSREFVGLR